MRYFGSYIGCKELKGDYVGDKVAAWASVVSDLAKLAVKHPQSVYAGYTICLQNEWTYLCRTTPDIAHLMEPLERVLRNELLPAFLGVQKEDITNEFRELLAFGVKGGGLGIRNPMMVAEEFYNTSLDCCNYLVETMISAEQLDQVRHKAHISDAVHRAGQCRHLTEADAYERRSRGKPAVKRRYRKALHGTGLFLTAIPSRMNGTSSRLKSCATTFAFSTTSNPWTCRSTAMAVAPR